MHFPQNHDEGGPFDRPTVPSSRFSIGTTLAFHSSLYYSSSVNHRKAFDNPSRFTADDRLPASLPAARTYATSEPHTVKTSFNAYMPACELALSSEHGMLTELRAVPNDRAVSAGLCHLTWLAGRACRCSDQQDVVKSGINALQQLDS